MNNILDISKNIHNNVSPVASDADIPIYMINEQMNLWKNAAESVVLGLSNTMPAIEQMENGEAMDPGFQNEITQLISDFDVLQSSTLKMTGSPGPISNFESTGQGYDILNNPLISIASGSSDDGINSVQVTSDSFSREILEQSVKLSTVMSAANRRKSELNDMWRTRQNAERNVYGTFTGIGTMAAIIALIIKQMK